MALSTTDLAILAVVGLAAAYYLFRDLFSSGPKLPNGSLPNGKVAGKVDAAADDGPTRDIVAALKKAVSFWHIALHGLADPCSPFDG